MSNTFIDRMNNKVLPRINSKKKLLKKNISKKISFRGNNIGNLINNKEQILMINSIEKKPGTSIDAKKPPYILPKIKMKKINQFKIIIIILRIIIKYMEKLQLIY